MVSALVKMVSALVKLVSALVKVELALVKIISVLVNVESALVTIISALVKVVSELVKIVSARGKVVVSALVKVVSMLMKVVSALVKVGSELVKIVSARVKVVSALLKVFNKIITGPLTKPLQFWTTDAGTPISSGRQRSGSTTAPIFSNSSRSAMPHAGQERPLDAQRCLPTLPCTPPGCPARSRVCESPYWLCRPRTWLHMNAGLESAKAWRLQRLSGFIYKKLPFKSAEELRPTCSTEATELSFGTSKAQRTPARLSITSATTLPPQDVAGMMTSSAGVDPRVCDVRCAGDPAERRALEPGLPSSGLGTRRMMSEAASDL
ncbi:uncharacterized protein [Narcine bancroftii]|uniref:uncharacterized protein n=1 Tax=Narcine bancroftii TaxID=1343680 RepID=UPI00383115C2